MGKLNGVISRNVLGRALACSVWLAAQTAFAEYRFDVWTIDSGLPQNSIGHILQSRDGYLWMTTLDGLVRFDGVRFTVFNKGNSPGLPSNRLTALHEDREGAVWVGTEEGGVARYFRERFETLTSPHRLPARTIGGIWGDADGHVWSLSGGVPLRWESGSPGRGLPEDTSALLTPVNLDLGSKGLLWSAKPDALVVFAAGKVWNFSASDGLPSPRVHSVAEDQQGTWWVSTDAGIARIQEGKIIKVYSQRDGLPIPSIANSAVPSGAMRALGEDRRGNLWLTGGAAWLGRLKNGVFTGYPNSNSPTLLPISGSRQQVAQINALLEDREGNIWITANGFGLIRAREQAVKVLSTRDGLARVNIYPVCADHEGGIWLGAWNFGLARIKGGAVTNFGSASRDSIVTALCESRDQRLWVASLADGVRIFANGELTAAGLPPVLTTLKVNAIFQDRNGAMWFGEERGLVRFANGEITVFTNRPGIAVASAKAIIEDRTGALWIGAYGGLTRLAQGEFTTWTERDGLPSDHVRALYEDGEGVLWIGTYDGGLGRLENGKFTRYTVRDGLFDNGVFQILEDARGNFWMSSNRGIHRSSKKELNEFAAGRRRTITSISYGKSDGMLNVECNGGSWPAGVKARDGKLWFPTQDGVAVIDPGALPSNPTPPPVVIESFLIHREPKALDGPLRVPPGKSNIEIQYTALSFINSERLQFRYRLTGVDHEWVEAGTRRTAYYSPLAPGQYAFTVLAANSDGLWNQTGATLAFTVLPAWYQTAWFRALALVAVVGASVGFYRSRISRLEAQRVAQENFSRRLIESQEQERQRLAAELHDSLGQNLLVIKNRAVMALASPNDPPKVCEQMTHVSEMASQALREVRGIAQDLRPFQLNEMGLTKAIGAMARRLADSSSIKFHIDVAELEGVLPRESEIHFYRVVQECLTNIVKHSHATQASVIVSKNGLSILRALIQDNGRGFDIVSSSDQPTPASFGLRSIRERVRALGGRVEFDTRPGEGASVVIEIPIHSA